MSANIIWALPLIAGLAILFLWWIGFMEHDPEEGDEDGRHW